MNKFLIAFISICLMSLFTYLLIYSIVNMFSLITNNFVVDFIKEYQIQEDEKEIPNIEEQLIPYGETDEDDQEGIDLVMVLEPVHKLYLEEKRKQEIDDRMPEYHSEYHEFQPLECSAQYSFELNRWRCFNELY